MRMPVELVPDWKVPKDEQISSSPYSYHNDNISV